MARESHAGRITGTFTNLRVTSEGVFGAEVRIAVTEEPSYQAVVQFGAGDECAPADRGTRDCFRVSNLYVVEAVFDSMKGIGSNAVTVSFDIPGGSGFSGHFEGILSNEALTGAFTKPGHPQQQWLLRRGISHWEQ